MYSEEMQILLSNRADEIIKKELDKGEHFSEGLCNWAISKAERELFSG